MPYSCMASLMFFSRAFLTAQSVKNLPATQETPVWILGRKMPWRRDRLPTHSILGLLCDSAGRKIPWRIPGTQSCLAESRLMCCYLGFRWVEGVTSSLKTHTHRVGDAIQPSHAAPSPSQHQGIFQWVNSLHEVVKVLEFQLQHLLTYNVLISGVQQWSHHTCISRPIHVAVKSLSWFMAE